ALAEGLAKGITGKSIHWYQKAQEWKTIFITYHPDGSPLINSSNWFHNDPWLTVNMIETNTHKDKVSNAIINDLKKQPLKPTILGEGHYEGIGSKETDTVSALDVRRQAYQSFFSGGAGFTYGAYYNLKGNGPLFSPSNNWETLLSMEGARQMQYLRTFLEDEKWWEWQSSPEIIIDGHGVGAQEKLAVRTTSKKLVYFADTTPGLIDDTGVQSASWYSTETGKTIPILIPEDSVYRLPDQLKDGILIMQIVQGQ
ncbi:apiosidase-like domain-containing protein, partial [Mariniphaga sediminis]|uniref:apiosidase-like domain-containing protein n=1 Tax=Mariniphaga sediminis TaxID=1628158 RepID=UPI00356B48DA